MPITDFVYEGRREVLINALFSLISKSVKPKALRQRIRIYYVFSLEVLLRKLSQLEVARFLRTESMRALWPLMLQFVALLMVRLHLATHEEAH